MIETVQKPQSRRNRGTQRREPKIRETCLKLFAESRLRLDSPPHEQMARRRACRSGLLTRLAGAGTVDAGESGLLTQPTRRNHCVADFGLRCCVA